MEALPRYSSFKLEDELNSCSCVVCCQFAVDRWFLGRSAAWDVIGMPCICNNRVHVLAFIPWKRSLFKASFACDNLVRSSVLFCLVP